MKFFAPIPLLIGLLLGSLTTYLFSQRSEPLAAVTKVETHFANDAEKKDEIQDNVIATNGAQAATSLKNKDEIKTSAAADSNHKDVQLCLQRLKPSDVEEWQMTWHKRVADFLSTNDELWDSKGHRSFDSRIMPSIKGLYQGSWTGMTNPRVKAEFKIEITTDVEGKIQLSLVDSGESPEQAISANCARDLIPKKDIGIDDKDNAVNVFMNNCNPEMLGPDFSQFAFKIPMNMSRGQTKNINIFGLTEDFRWQSAGSFAIQKK